FLQPRRHATTFSKTARRCLNLVVGWLSPWMPQPGGIAANWLERARSWTGRAGLSALRASRAHSCRHTVERSTVEQWSQFHRTRASRSTIPENVLQECASHREPRSHPDKG